MSKLQPKISVVIPMYNAEQYLSTCLSSCIQQTLYDIEIICVDDGSTDQTAEIVRQYMKEDYRIQLLQKANGGLSSARNKGIAHATGKYIMFLDSDDYYSLDACEKVWEEVLECEPDIITFGTSIFPLQPKAQPWYYWTLSVDRKRYSSFSPKVLFENRSSKPFVWRQAYKRTFLDEYGLTFDESARYGEDMVFQMEAFPHGKRFSYLSDNLYHYRHFREGSLMANMAHDRNKKVSQHITIARIITDYWNKEGWLQPYKRDYVQWLLTFVLCVSDDKAEGVAEENYRDLVALLKKFDLFGALGAVPVKEWDLVRTVKKHGKR